MSTPTTPGVFATPAAGWYPNLSAKSSTKDLADAITQGYQLLYSLRDALNQQQQSLARTIQYGTAQQLSQSNAQAVPNGALWFDTDDGNSYQARLAPQQTTRQWTELVSAGGAEGPAGPQGPPGPAGPVNPQNFLYNPGIVTGVVYQNNFGLPLWVKMLMSWGGGQDAGIAAQISAAPPVTQVVATTYIPATTLGGIQLEAFFIVPVNWFYQIVATGGGTISSTAMWY